MTVPVIPEATQQEALTGLLESIALEEAALAHLVNAEAEKVQAVAGLMAGDEMEPSEVIDLQRSVRRVVQTAIKMQMLLQFKLENVLRSISQLLITVHENMATATGFYNGMSYTDTDYAYYHSRSGSGE
jgi:hypothetical protein